MLSLKKMHQLRFKNIKRYMFHYYNIPTDVMLLIYEFIDLWKYIYDNVIFDIEMGIHTTELFYDIPSVKLPKLTAFKIPQNIKKHIIAYKDIYIPLSSILQMNQYDIDSLKTEDIITKFNTIYNDHVLEDKHLFDSLKFSFDLSLISKKEYDRLYQKYTTTIQSNQCKKIQYVSLTNKYQQPIHKLQNLIIKNHSDPMQICNNCDCRYKVSSTLKQCLSLSISDDMKEPYYTCTCKDSIS